MKTLIVSAIVDAVASALRGASGAQALLAIHARPPAHQQDGASASPLRNAGVIKIEININR